MKSTLKGTTRQSIVVNKKYYRFSTTATEIYLCEPLQANCLGSTQNSSDSTNSSDRRRRRLSKIDKIVTDSLCNEGSYGPLCSLCDAEYYLDSSKGRCQLCRYEWVAPVLGLLGFAALCAGLVLSRRLIFQWVERNKSWLPGFGEKLV